ncbi:MAG: hypothetical protein GY801_34095 [bacterium]|nr:hypothetical protein [bacterium]
MGLKRAVESSEKFQFLIYAMICFLLSISYQTAYSQSCDPKLTPDKNFTLKYRGRGNRCEGLYRTGISAPAIEVVGATEGKFQFELKQDEVLEISSSISRGQTIHVRAMGIPDKLYYRMDTELKPGQTLQWPVAEVLYLEQFSYKEIGVFGWVGAETEKIYIPVVVATTVGPVANDVKIRLYLRTSVNVKNMQWRAADAIDGGCPDLTQIEYTKAPKIEYSEGTPIEIILPPGTTGQVRVEAAARDQKTMKWLKKKNIRVVVRKE